jgi:hypothetical protein
MANKERVKKALPEFFQDSKNFTAFMNVFEGMVRDYVGDKTQTLIEQKNPEKMDLSLKEGVAEMLGFDAPQIRDQTEEQERQQLKNVTEWIKIKGLEIAMKSYLSSVGFRINDTEVMMSDDYQSFVRASDAPKYNDQYQYTPHVKFDITQKQTINGNFLTQEMFEILRYRIQNLAPITTVPHFDYTLKIYGNEDQTVVGRNNVKGVTSDQYQPVDADYMGQGNHTDPGCDWTILDNVTHSYIENVSKVNFGTLSGSIGSSVDSLDTVLYSKSNVTFTPRPDLGEYKVSFPFLDSNFAGQTINAVTLQDQYGRTLAIGTFPDIELLDFELLGFNMEFIVLENERELIRAYCRDESKTDGKYGYGEEGYGEGGYGGQISDSAAYAIDDNGSLVYTFLTGSYNFSYDQDITFELPFHFDQGLHFDDEGKIPYLAHELKDEGIKRGSYAVGDLSGYSGPMDELALNSGDLWNPLYQSADDFNLYYQNELSSLVFEADLTKCQLQGHVPQQLGIYDRNDDLMLVSQFDQFSIDKQTDNKWFRLEMEIV